jgi:hypothetical protein
VAERLCWFESSPGHLMIKPRRVSGGAFSLAPEPNEVRARKPREKPQACGAGPASIHFTAEPGGKECSVGMCASFLAHVHHAQVVAVLDQRVPGTGALFEGLIQFLQVLIP